MLRRLTIPVLLVLAAPACGGKVVVDHESTESTTGTGVGSTGGVGGSGSTGSAGTTGGTGGTGGIGGSGGGAPECAENHETLNASLFTWDGKSFGCDFGAGDYELSAQIVDNDNQGHFALDSCSPAADCIPFISKLVIDTPWVSIVAPKGTYVKVHIAVEPFMGGCSQRIQIKNLPVWDGDPNPIMPGERLWFLGVDGGATAFDDSPVMATALPLGCFPGAPPGCGEVEAYSWHFQAAGKPDDPGVIVPMAQAFYWDANLTSGFDSLVARNIRSFSTGACDGPVDLAYWVAYTFPPQ
jgi:hypothetical protein